MLHTIVCLKVVPKSEEVTIDEETRTLDRASARSEINSPDMNALEVALQLKSRHGGRVSLVSMGPPLFERFLRLGLAMGADAAWGWRWARTPPTCSATAPSAAPTRSPLRSPSRRASRR
jgi:electron transfer flavoprotein alpha/beta subunit